MNILGNVPEELLEDDERNAVRDPPRYYQQIYEHGPRMNEEQQKFVDAVMDGLHDAKQVIGDPTGKTQFVGHQRYFMLTGEGGAGKTFTYNVVF